MPVTAYLLVSAAMFCLGLYGALTRRNAIGVLIGFELMANAAALNLVAFGRYHGNAHGQVVALFLLALTVAEVAVGLSILILLQRARRSVLTEVAAEMKG